MQGAGIRASFWLAMSGEEKTNGPPIVGGPLCDRCYGG